jgi:hypothetical protein
VLHNVLQNIIHNYISHILRVLCTMVMQIETIFVNTLAHESGAYVEVIDEKKSKKSHENVSPQDEKGFGMAKTTL